MRHISSLIVVATLLTSGCPKKADAEEKVYDPSQPLPAGHPPVNATGTGPAAAPQEPTPRADLPRNALPPPPPGVDIGPHVKGTVVETAAAADYTYLKVKSAERGEVWTAIAKAPINVGDEVVIGESVVMQNFNSKALNRTFPTLIMGVLIGAPKKPAAAP